VREVGTGPFGVVIVDPVDGSVTIRRFRSRGAAVMTVPEAILGSAAGVVPSTPAASRLTDDREPDPAA
jgi:hypothetical protein